MNLNHIPSLDGIRAISVLIVLFSHAGLGQIVPGGLGVTVFFFLSGFLITSLLKNEFDRSATISFPKFFLRRLFRLFPPLGCCLAIVYGLTALGVVEGGISISGFLAQVFYLANYRAIFDWQGAIPKGLGVLWSLAVEEHFYLIFPLTLLVLLSKFNRCQYLLCLAAICLLILLWRIYLVSEEDVSAIRTYYATDTRIDSILYGCILALSVNPVYAVRSPDDFGRKWTLLCFSTGLLLISLLLRDEFFRETFRYSLQGVALMPLFYYAIRDHDQPMFKWLNWAWIKKLGVYSYCIYLLHHVVIGAVKTYSYGHYVVVQISVTLALSILFAFVVDRYVDGYFKKMRAKLH